jgi:hypothetical protein
MIIYDDKNKRRLTGVTLFLTPEEAAELGDSAIDLSENPDKRHQHVSSSDYSSEITLAVYTKDNLSGFDTESQFLICENAKGKTK